CMSHAPEDDSGALKLKLPGAVVTRSSRIWPFGALSTRLVAPEPAATVGGRPKLAATSKSAPCVISAGVVLVALLPMPLATASIGFVVAIPLYSATRTSGYE